MFNCEDLSKGKQKNRTLRCKGKPSLIIVEDISKIWIVRERLDWHNCDPYDNTIAYATRELAEAGLVERIAGVKKYFRENEYELFDDMTKIESDFGRMVTERDDWYSCWIEEIDMFNE